MIVLVARNRGVVLQVFHQPVALDALVKAEAEDLEPILVTFLQFWVLASTGTSDLRRLLGNVEVHQGRDFHRLSCLGFVRVQAVPLLIVVLIVLHAIGLVLALPGVVP